MDSLSSNIDFSKTYKESVHNLEDALTSFFEGTHGGFIIANPLVVSLLMSLPTRNFTVSPKDQRKSPNGAKFMGILDCRVAVYMFSFNIVRGTSSATGYEEDIVAGYFDRENGSYVYKRFNLTK